VEDQKQDIKFYWKNDQQENFKVWVVPMHYTLMVLFHAPTYPNKIGYKLMVILA
jgi:hypothetical protein